MPPVSSTSSPRPDGFSQDCSRCRLVSSCWASRHGDLEVTAHLLVCRLQTGDEAAASLLVSMLHEHIEGCLRGHGATAQLRDYGMDFDDVLQEALLETIRYLRDDHILGDRWALWPRLFGHLGLIASWVRNYLRTMRRNQLTPLYIEDIDHFDPPDHAARPDEVLLDQETTALIEKAGLTEGERDAALALLFGEEPDRAARNRRLAAARKLLTLLGDEEYVPVPGNRARRLAKAEGRKPWPLTVAERGAIMKYLREGVPKTDLGWAYGVNVAAISRVADH